MNRSRPPLLLPATVVFAGVDLERRRWTTPAACGDSTEPDEATETETGDWNLFLGHCRALLLAEGDDLSSAVLDSLSVHLVTVCNNCYRAGLTAGIRQSARVRAEAARAVKRQRTDERGRIVQRAIIAVCAQQRVAPAASQKFAVSIQAEVIEAARHFGLSDVNAGTSTRSIQRHIAALLKYDRMA